jgi:hypothetical protein
MSTDKHHSIYQHMDVYSSDNTNLGQVDEVDEVYEDSFLLHKGIFGKHRYIPYELISSVEKDRVNLRLSRDEASEMKWEKRPDYEHHLGDPTQLFYDRGHDIHDPFDETNPDQA